MPKTTPQDLVKTLEKVNVIALGKLALFQNKDAIVDLNREQMREGLTSKGYYIAPDYSNSYAREKLERSTYNAPVGVPDLFDTGSFHKGMFVNIFADTFSITSKDEKTGDLTERYKDIFGLTEENMQEAQRLITESFIYHFRKETGL